MTLVLTELSLLGIAMAADSAVTTPSLTPNRQRIFPRVLIGVTKLFPIHKLQAGVCAWGLGQISAIDTDVWLKNFIVSNEDRYSALQDFVLLLQNELRKHVPDIDLNQYPYGTVGFHVTGFVEWKGRKLPDFYHVHNGRSQVLESRGQASQIDPRRVNANHDMPPEECEKLFSQGMAYITRNGDYQMYAALSSLVEQFFDMLGKRGFQIPYPPSLKARAEYLRFWIKTMSEIYRLSNIVPGIGGPVTSLIISERGIEGYETL